MQLPPWSYTFLSDAENCLKKAFHKYIAKDVPKETSPQLDWGNVVHEGAEKRLAVGKKLSPNLIALEPMMQTLSRKPVTAEMMLGVRRDGSSCGFFDKDVYGRGKVDVSILMPPRGWFGDYKTGKKKEDPTELRIQAVLLQARYPAIRTIKGNYIWLSHDLDKDLPNAAAVAKITRAEVGREHDLSDTANQWAAINERVAELQRCADTSYWPPHENPLCGWCAVKSCQFNPKRGT